MNELSELELSDFSKLRAIVSRTKESAAEFYDALTDIQRRHLYRAEFKTWDNFCQKELGKSSRALTFTLEAHAIRKEIGNTVSEITDRTARALKNVKAVSRKKVFHKALEIAAGKPVSPTHIAHASTIQQVTIHNLAATGAYSSAPKEQRASPPAAVIHATDLPPAPPITDTISAIANIDAIYELHKPWFNDISTGRPRTPRQVIDKLISELRNAA